MIEHAINVCVYAVKLGVLDGLEEEELRTLAVGALLHDIGKLGTSSSVFPMRARSDFT